MAEAEKKEENNDIDPSKDKALGNGWSERDDWKGAPEDWVDYRDFNLRGEFMGRIHEQSSIIKHLTDKVDDRDIALQNMSDLQGKISEREYKKALNDLKSKKKEALEADAYDVVVDIDEEISDLKDKKPTIEPAKSPEKKSKGDGQPEIMEWLSKPAQSWYYSDSTMRGMAEGVAAVALQDNPELTPQQIIKKVDATLRKELPHKFTDQSVDEGGGYNGSKPGRPKGKMPGFSALSDEQKEVCKRLERLGTLTREEYIKSLVEIGEIE